MRDAGLIPDSGIAPGQRSIRIGTATSITDPRRNRLTVRWLWPGNPGSSQQPAGLINLPELRYRVLSTVVRRGLSPHHHTRNPNRSRLGFSALVEPGKPWQNGTNESFNGKFRDECLSMEWFHPERSDPDDRKLAVPLQGRASAFESGKSDAGSVPANLRPCRYT